jgi:hypothetical protein
MSLDDQEDAFRERQARSGARLVIVAMQIPEDDNRFLSSVKTVLIWMARVVSSLL